MTAQYQYPAISWRVVDGDTVECVRDCGCEIYHEVTVRLDGIDAPELNKKSHRPAAMVVADWVEYWLMNWDDAGIMLESHRLDRGKHGRLIGDFRPVGSKQTLTQYLIEQGVVVPTVKGRRHNWTDEELRSVEERSEPCLT